ncbi:GNAT family N-acetyltransferase [Nocardioides acrostichi]|uniref:GNAT family N-acetyltransferase n=1 Tax=Nocardioides acrostichi TaxID=2784339 RepID=A0A930UYD8_9ACTN|nr:GNAT family N-acetyltransferase [Nocardioides acrostichi]MBF4161997.1 GNAT family N-acetyltransferase [Nocardioides acrostichi]
MRLTNVAHLRLPFGQLLGYDLAVDSFVDDAPVSFDQARHVGAGDRPGSWMALSFHLDHAVDLVDLETAWLAVVQRHGTLRTVFSPATQGPRLHRVTLRPRGWVEHPIEPGQAVNDALREVLDATCRPYATPSHRLCLLRTADGPTIVVAADHAHVDMWSMLVIARDLLAALDGRSLPAVPPFADHTRALRERPQAPAEIRRRWSEVLGACGGVMPRFPMPLGDLSTLQVERVELRDVLDVDAIAAFAVRAREAGVSTLALVVAAMTEVTRELADTPLRAVFPVHSRYDAQWHDSVGWFITNSVLESPDTDPRACGEAVKEAVQMGSWPLEDVLEPWGGMPDAPGMFAISWLDLRRLPVRVDSTGLQAQYVGAAVLTDGVMLWFILDESGLHLRCRYPDTREARRNVGRWLDALVARLRRWAIEATGGHCHLEGRTYRIERAQREDLPAIVRLLVEDPVAATREFADDPTRYEAGFDRVARDPAQFLAVVRDDTGAVVGTMQLTMQPGVSRGGATRMQVEAVRVEASLRGSGLGSAMLEWAHDHARARGAHLAQLTSDKHREDAHRFYERLGYEPTHVGFKKPL